MSRSQALIESALAAFETPTPSALYQWIQHLDSEYTRHRYPELLLHHLHDISIPYAQQLALVAAVEALRLAMQLQLHTHSRRVLAVATLCRALNDNIQHWQQLGLKQPLWCAAFYNPNRSVQSDSYYFSQWVLRLAQAQLETDVRPLQQLLSYPHRAHYWQFAEHLHRPAHFATGVRLESVQTTSAVYFLSASTSYWQVFDSQRQTLAKISARDYASWHRVNEPLSTNLLQQLDYLRALNQTPLNPSFKAPKALLSAIKRYTTGTGALAPVINYIQQRPLLADSIRQAAVQNKLHANDPARMEIKHLYLWLGGQRASIVLATASLQQQFMQQRVPLQQSLMQRLSLLTELLQRLSQQVALTLPVPASLLALLTAADLFREPMLLRASHWPQVHQLASLTKQSWLGVAEDANTAVRALRMSRQLAARWQLEKQLTPLFEHHAESPLVALMGVANILVATSYHPEATMTESTQKQWFSALTQLKLSQERIEALRQDAIAQCHPCCPLTELTTVSPNHSSIK